MSRTGSILLGTVVLLLGAALSAWFVWRTIQKAEEPGRVFFKWIATAVILGILLYLGSQIRGSGMGGAFMIPVMAAVFGLVLGIIWAPHLGAVLARPFTAFYDGGEMEVEARPFYSIARARQKLGRYPEALAEIHKQLERFSQDYEGWMFQAEIYGDNLRDNSAAQRCVDEILSHPNHSPKNIAYALNRAADWHLHLASDRDAAKERLGRIAELFPETEFAHTAAQRVAHLTTGKMLSEQRERPAIALMRRDERIGLIGQVADPRPAPEDPSARATRLVEHLGEHPLDAEAREELARIYVRHYQRLDLAADQVEQVIAQPGSSQKQIARWLNMLADFHIELGPDRTGAEAALRRIVELFPETAVAANAESRIAYLEHELHRNTVPEALKLGSYEKNIGLAGSVPKKPGDS